MITPYYADDWVTVYNLDYRELLAELIDMPITAVITDPPFNAGKSFANDDMSARDFMAFCNQLAIDLYRMAPANLLIEVGKNDRTMRQEIDRYFDYRYAIALNYTNSMRQGAIGYSNWGLVHWYGSGRCENRYMDRIDSALHNTKAEFQHDSPKEITHYRRLVHMFSRPGDLIVDLFGGTGTTAIAAKMERRRSIICEISAAHCRTIATRLASTQAPAEIDPAPIPATVAML